MKLSYEKPTITKYGSMKQLTVANTGSGGDVVDSGTQGDNSDNTGKASIPLDTRLA